MRDNLESLPEPSQADNNKRSTIQGDDLNSGKRRRVTDSVSPVALPVKSSTHPTPSGISQDNINRAAHLTELRGSSHEHESSRSKTIIIRDPNRTDNRAVFGKAKWKSNRNLRHGNHVQHGHIVTNQDSLTSHRDMRLQNPAYSSSGPQGTPSIVKKILSQHGLLNVQDISTLIINKERRTATSSRPQLKTASLSSNPQFVDINSVKVNPTRTHSFEDYSQQKSSSLSDPQRSYTVMPDSDASGTPEPVPTQLFVNNLELDKRRLTQGLEGQRKASSANHSGLSPPDLVDSSYGEFVRRFSDIKLWHNVKLFKPAFLYQGFIHYCCEI